MCEKFLHDKLFTEFPSLLRPSETHSLGALTLQSSDLS
jgi:hypothetical protein